MNTLFWLDQIGESDRSQVGDQAWNLSLLVHEGYSVLPGFVIPAAQFQRFLETIHWIEPMFADLPHSSLRLNLEDSQQLQSIARQIRKTIQHAEIPEAWLTELISAIAQFPQFGTNQAVILRPSFALTTPKSYELASLIEPQVSAIELNALAIALKQLWAELFRARNLVVWQNAKLELTQIQFAIVVQPIASVVASGYLRAEATNSELVATPGLEFAIASGEVLPDRYQISSDGTIKTEFGRQTIAYQIQSGSQPLVRSTLNAKALNAEQLQPFITLTQQLQQRFKPPFTLHWQLYETSSQPYLTVLEQLDDTALPEVIKADVIVAGLAASSGTAIAPAYVLSNPPASSVPSGSVLVTSMFLPEHLPLIQTAAAIVSEQGGMTSHGAILARELGIPAIVGAQHATVRLQTGETIAVDGALGTVTRAENDYSHPTRIISDPDRSPTATRLMINLSQIEHLDQLSDLEIDGIGLLRSDVMLSAILSNQSIQERAELINRLAAHLQTVARSVTPRPVFYRSLDLPANADHLNPMLGLRGTFSYVQDPTVFELELSALGQAVQAGCSNLRLVLPFVRTVEEFRFCHRRVEQAGLLNQRSFQLWIMAEVPAVVFLLPEFVQAGVQGICIGTSDLTQLMLGVDRDQSQMAIAFDQTHPAVMSAIAQLIQSAQRLKIGCSISTQSTQPELIDRLVEWGIDAISVNLGAINATHRAIVRAEQRLLMNQVRKQNTAFK